MAKDLLGLRRQDYPRGTPEGGAFVQTVDGESLSTIESHPDWVPEPPPITVSSSVVQLDGAQRLSTNYAYITVEDAAIRFWIGGKQPTATVGHFLEPGDILVLKTSDEIQDIQFIRRDGVNATLHVSYGIR